MDNIKHKTLKASKKNTIIGTIGTATLAMLLVLTISMGEDGEPILTASGSEYISCPNGKCDFQTKIVNNISDSMVVDLSTIKITDSPAVSEYGGGLVLYRNVTNIEYTSYDYKQSTDNYVQNMKFDANGTWSSEVKTKDGVLHLIAYNYNTTILTTVVKEKNVTKLVKYLEKGNVTIQKGRSITPDVYFTVPINTAGKFTVELDVWIEETKYHLVYDPYYNSSAFPLYQELNAQSTGTISNYSQVVYLNSTNVGAGFNWSSDGDGVLFTNMSDYPIGFWIEDWNSTAENATVWVKLETMTSGANTSFKMYYGNSSAGTINNITDAFLFGCDFDSENCSLYRPSYSTVTAVNYWSWDNANNYLKYRHQRDPAGNDPAYPYWIDITDFTSSSWEMIFENTVTGRSYADYGTQSGLGICNGHPSNLRNGGTYANYGDWHRVVTNCEKDNNWNPKNWALASSDSSGSSIPWTYTISYITGLSTAVPMDVRLYYNGTHDNLSVLQSGTSYDKAYSLAWDNNTFTYLFLTAGTGSTSHTNPYESGYIDDLIIRNYLSTTPTVFFGPEQGGYVPTLIWSNNITIQHDLDFQGDYSLSDLHFFGMVSDDTTSWRCYVSDTGELVCKEVI